MGTSRRARRNSQANCAAHLGTGKWDPLLAGSSSLPGVHLPSCSLQRAATAASLSGELGRDEAAEVWCEGKQSLPKTAFPRGASPTAPDAEGAEPLCVPPALISVGLQDLLYRGTKHSPEHHGGALTRGSAAIPSERTWTLSFSPFLSLFPAFSLPLALLSPQRPLASPCAAYPRAPHLPSTHHSLAQRLKARARSCS